MSTICLPLIIGIEFCNCDVKLQITFLEFGMFKTVLIECDIKTLKESVDGVGWVAKGSCVGCQLNLRPFVSCHFESHLDPLEV